MTNILSNISLSTWNDSNLVSLDVDSHIYSLQDSKTNMELH